MKKFLSLLVAMLAVGILQADTITDNNINEVKALIQKQDIVAGATDMYIMLYGTIPANVTALKSANLLGSSFTYAGTISVNGTTKTITLTDSIANPESYQNDYYINTNDRDKYSVHTVLGSSFIAAYPFTSKAIYTYLIKATSGAVVSPTIPSSPTSGMVWLNTLTKQLYYYASGAWVSLNVRKLWILRDVSELPASATLNDGAVVLKATSLVKYLYTSTGWKTIPGTVPFTYNGIF